MEFRSIEEALTVLHDTQDSEVTRAQAAHYLAKHPEPRTIEHLIKALEDNDTGVHWAAADALAGLGEWGFTPLLHALIQRPSSARLRSGVLYVVGHSSSWAVRQKEAQLREALEGPAGGFSAMRVAQDLLHELPK